jgi:chemotaxis protein histidine kinase CheA
MSTETYDQWVREALGVDPEQHRGQSNRKPLKAGPDRQLVVKLTVAQDSLDESLSKYRASKAAAQAVVDIIGKMDDPGAKIEKTAADVKKDANTAVAAIRKGDIATASKLLPSIETRVRDVAALAGTYAVAVDKASADGATKMATAGKTDYYKSAADKEDDVKTPWGNLHILSLQANTIVPYVVRLSSIPEADKLFAAKYEAAVKEQEEAVKPMAEYLASPAKMEAEIAKAASEQAVSWAEQANTNEELAKLKSVFNDNLVTQIEHAKSEWDAFKKELDSQDLKDKAAELRIKAEEQEKQLDFAIEAFKAVVEIAANPEEGAANAAAELAGAAIKYFHENEFAKQAEEAEREAASLHRDSVTRLVESAKKATDDLTKQIEKIGPLSDEVQGSIERNVGRAIKQFDDKDAPAQNVKFRFKDLQQAIQTVAQLTQARRRSADDRYRNVWAGADANLAQLRTNLAKYEKDDDYGHAKTFQFDQGISWNRSVLDAITNYIDGYSKQTYQQAQNTGDYMPKLLSLNTRAFAALKKART